MNNLGSDKRGKLEEMPAFNPDDRNQPFVDLWGYDLSHLDLRDRLDDLLNSSFDTRTKWPSVLPVPFDPVKVMELGRRPGLGLEELHRKGITGKGVGIAILDQAILVEHEEYKDRIRCYEEIHCLDHVASMHGPAVATIAVGKTAGVAPGADLYYIGESHYDGITAGTIDWNLSYLARAIDRVLEINATLPRTGKIRVISISLAWRKDRKGWEDVAASVEKARKAGVFVASCSMPETYGFFLLGMGRDPLADPGDWSSWGPGRYWAGDFFEGKTAALFSTAPDRGTPILMVPMDSRTVASPSGPGDYIFYRVGGLSWAVPYVAGLYALVCQVRPDITPESFWELAVKTGRTTRVSRDGHAYEFGVIADPRALIEAALK
jgi:subtilisin family serine protease